MLDELLPVFVATISGALIGIERGWSLRTAADGSRVAGVRTFSMLGLLAGISGYLVARDYALASASLMAGAAAIVVIGYFRSSGENGKPDATSAIAAVLTLALGFLAGIGQFGMALAGAALLTLMLALRKETHRLIGRLDEADIKALARYAVIALAIFPFLPEGPYGPYDAWNPRNLWFVVILVTGFSFAGYAANRIFGTRRGTIATALIGGAYSSTAVTYSFAQKIGAGDGGGAENAGIALASAVMYLRVLLLVAILARPLLEPFVLLVLPALVTGAVTSGFLYRRAPHSSGPSPPGNPIALLPAFSFVAFVAVAAVAARWAESRFGEEGIAVLLLLMGSMDVDAAIITAGGLEPGSISPALAALAIAGTILANMTVKLGVTIAYGRRSGRPAAIALAASMAALGLSLIAGWFAL
ncbi:DUF4010 domain-containing protein [Altererythrobacter luteolus]|uniref:DUF4010 domain-containing protein n=1 Tax=Pontixanthobacter luteolus TaxID=295089 RepID=A0A6I4UZ52_9SPHN|nr:DUF4010 domain-containing protein [Pontixanthobacter luteolus]MXP46858.1 DUF4010 domain-containing protein [Pontixanthobacter luteolus]